MSIIDAIILGIIQGLTEFLPVSSSGHIELGKVILNAQVEDNLLFSIVVHFATALSTIIIYRNDIWHLIKGVFAFKLNDETTYILKLLLSMIPVGVIGVLFEDEIEALFSGNVLLVGSMLLLTAVLLAFTYFKKDNIGKVTYKNAFIIGIAQAIAILPGVSRSGATISTSLMLGVEKSRATRFSFLMVLLPIMGATVLKIKDYAETSHTLSDTSTLSLIAGFFAAFISGIFACSWMIKIVRRGKLIYFAVYCLIVGLIAVSYALI